MGLLCFGAVGFVRAAAALLPGYASRFAVQKLAAVSGFAYLILSGMSVGIADFTVLLVSQLSLFTAGMQLSFAATAALVICFEGRRHAREGRSRPVRWLRDLTAASLVAGGATMPLTAYHFGAVAL